MAGTNNCGIMYARTKNKYLIVYTDSDFIGILDDGKSTSGYVFHLGSSFISWASKKQLIVTRFFSRRKICSSNINNMSSSLVKKSIGWTQTKTTSIKNNIL